MRFHLFVLVALTVLVLASAQDEEGGKGKGRKRCKSGPKCPDGKKAPTCVCNQGSTECGKDCTVRDFPDF